MLEYHIYNIFFGISFELNIFIFENFLEFTIKYFISDGDIDEIIILFSFTYKYKGNRYFYNKYYNNNNFQELFS